VLVAVVVLAVLVLAGTGGSPRRTGVAPTETTAPATTTPPTPSTPTGIGPPARSFPQSRQFGAAVNTVFRAFTFTQPQVNAQLQALAQTGARIARIDAFWESAEPSAPINGIHHYDWSFADLVAGSLAAHGLKWLPIIDYSAPWAQSVPGQDHSPPSSGSDYAAYAAAFAARYGSGGSFWREHPNLPAEPVDTYEIWNEPDSAHFWVPAPNASAYVDLYLRARDAITTVDPAARVIVGGLTNPAAFVPAMLAARPALRGHIDGIGIHPYLPTPLAVLAAVHADRTLLTSLGLASVPLYVTEFGWTTRPAGALQWVPPRLRPKYIAATLDALGHLDCGVAGAVLFSWVTPERSPANGFDWYGIHRLHGGDSADTVAFAAGLRSAARPGPPVKLCAPR
jgi:hypothetical protein